MPAKSSDAQLRARIATLYATDAQFASARPDPAITEEIERAGTRLADMVAIALTGYADRPALGQRRTRLVTDPATGRATLELLPVFDTITYRELWARTTALTAALTAARVGPGDRVCVLGFTSIDYATVSLALLRLGVVTVPLQTSAPAAELGPIVEETDPRVIATAVENLEPGGAPCGGLQSSSSVGGVRLSRRRRRPTGDRGGCPADRARIEHRRPRDAVGPAHPRRGAARPTADRRHRQRPTHLADLHVRRLTTTRRG